MNKELAANTILLHYRIVSKIGAGGMGEVYLAQDTKLDRISHQPRRRIGPSKYLSQAT